MDLEKENAEIDESHISIKSNKSINYLNKTREEDLEYDFGFDPDLKESKEESTQCLNINSILNSTEKDVYLKKKKSFLVNKKTNIHSKLDDGIIEQIDTLSKEFIPDLATIIILFKMYDIHFKEKPNEKVTFIANKFRRNFDPRCESLLKCTNNHFVKKNDIYKDNFKFLNIFKKAEECKSVSLKKQNKNTVSLTINSFDELKKLINDLIIKYNIKTLNNRWNLKKHEIFTRV